MTSTNITAASCARPAPRPRTSLARADGLNRLWPCAHQFEYRSEVVVFLVCVVVEQVHRCDVERNRDAPQRLRVRRDLAKLDRHHMERMDIRLLPELAERQTALSAQRPDALPDALNQRDVF
jgi:hypothetical protein